MMEHDRFVMWELHRKKCAMYNVGAMMPWMDYRRYFDCVEFAVYCRNTETDQNYRNFRIWKHYYDDAVTVIDSGKAAREEFGELFGGFTVRVSREQIDALRSGKQLAINVRDEYMLFLEGPEGK